MLATGTTKMNFGNFKDLIGSTSSFSNRLRALGRILTSVVAIGFLFSAYNTAVPFLPEDDVTALVGGGFIGFIFGGVKLVATA